MSGAHHPRATQPLECVEVCGELVGVLVREIDLLSPMPNTVLVDADDQFRQPQPTRHENYCRGGRSTSTHTTGAVRCTTPNPTYDAS
ncbi:hypothetical protein EP51_46170 (plasmid) [Rhodococcus opacus]|uniref:Uncharacterized protein n=1 Tax=Rhodococcus opacus TaxID=37919 RepID=A0A076F196_RHOOP|nr:hypothetical protein EP51_46170 [Rhodococcus opacus]